MKKFFTVISAAVMTLACSMPSYAGTWKQDMTGWWYQNGDGTYPADGWEWLDGNCDGTAECYCFDQSGYLLTNATTPDGFQVNENGAWIVDGIVQVQEALPDEATAEVVDHGYEEICVQELAYQIMESVNEERVKNGKEKLKINEELMENAAVRAEEAYQKPGHIRPDGTGFRTAITADHTAAGENMVLALQEPSYPTMQEVSDYAVSNWMNSSKHKKNLLDGRWEETGIGIYQDGRFFHIIQIFIRNERV